MDCPTVKSLPDSFDMAKARGKDVQIPSAPPRNDAFTSLLLVSTAALLGGCGLLAYVLTQYDWALK